MTPKRLAQALGALLTLAVIFIGCNDFGKVTETTKQVAKDLLEGGRKAGVFGTTEQYAVSGQTDSKATPSGAVNQTPVYWQVPRSQSHIAIGTFNIETFGVTKISKPEVVETLVNIVRQFDCLAIQELRSKDDSVIRHFVDLINSNGSRYSAVVSPRLGNSYSKEQYVFIYDTNRIELVDRGFVVNDPQNVLHREPYVAFFRTRTADRRLAFTFALANIHTDPDVTHIELPALAQIFVWLQQYVSGEDDIILLGDFNEPPERYGPLRQVPNLVHALPGHIPTNTRKTKSYDNLLLDGSATREFSGLAGVLDIAQVFGLSYEQAVAVSDHLPVWALFSGGEVFQTQYANQRSPSYGNSYQR